MAAGRKLKVFDDETTKDAGTDSKIVTVLGYHSFSACIKELNVNAVKWTIKGTMDLDDTDAPWIDIMSATSVAKNGKDYFPNTEAEEVLASTPWDAVKIFVEPDVAGSQGKVNAWIIAKRR